MIAKWGQPSEESKTKGGDICDSLLFEKDKKITTYITTLIDKHLRNVTSRDRLVKDCMRVPILRTSQAYVDWLMNNAPRDRNEEDDEDDNLYDEQFDENGE